MKRTLAITVVFVVLNGVGVVYRVVINHDERAGAMTAPIAPAMASERPPERVPADPPAIAASPPDPPAIEAQSPGSQEISQTGRHKPVDPAPVGSRPAKPTTVPKVGQQRRPGADSRSARPRVPPPEPEHAPAPVAAPPVPPPVPPATTVKPDSNLRNEDSLRKMEANPYKRGE